MVMGTYKTAFIIPLKTKKILTDIGWIFESNNCIPSNLSNFLTDNLKLKYEEEYQGIISYRNESLQAVISVNDNGGIESIHLKLYDKNMTRKLIREFNRHGIKEYAEIFIPS
jgi:hypothetical protein